MPQEARRSLVPETMPGPTGETNSLRYRGRGVFVCISPWNFPLAIFTGQVMAALAAGNAVVAKPAEQTPLIAAEAVRLFHRAGIPATALHLVPGDGMVGGFLVAHPDVAGIAFTGSTEVARIINRTLAAKETPIVPLIAETGGINAMIVDATALPEQVTDDVIASAFRSAGQRCSALRLLCLQEDIADGVIEMVAGAAQELAVGDPARHRHPCRPGDRRRGQGQARHVGGRHGGAGPPGVPLRPRRRRCRRRARSLRRRSSSSTAPATSRRRCSARCSTWCATAPRRLDRLLDDIAASGYGLTLGVQSRIDATVRRVVARLSAGNVYVNRNMIGAVVGTQPFGGSGLSGTGPKAGGPNYLRRFALEQVVSVNTAAVGGNASLLAEQS